MSKWSLTQMGRRATFLMNPPPSGSYSRHLQVTSESLITESDLTQRRKDTKKDCLTNKGNELPNAQRHYLFSSFASLPLCVFASRMAHHPKPQRDLGLNLRRRKLLVTTETLESDIAALAMIGDSSQPVI